MERKRYKVKTNAGNVEKGNEMFNNATNIGTSLVSDAVGESMKTINIREELNKRDMESCETDFVNMYESANLSREKKVELIKLLSENVGNKELNKFFNEELFTPEEQEEYNIDEEGNSLSTYDTYHRCAWCDDITPDARKELNMGWLCPGCVNALVSRGEKPVFDDYGAFESLAEDIDITNYTNTNTNSKPLKQATFTVDDGERFKGYDEDYSWNGWDCPWFTKEESFKIAEWLNSYTEDSLTFDETKDAFKYVLQDDSDDIDYYVGANINTEDGVKHLYPIGNKSWTWDKVAEYEVDVEPDDSYFWY